MQCLLVHVAIRRLIASASLASCITLAFLLSCKGATARAASAPTHESEQGESIVWTKVESLADADAVRVSRDARKGVVITDQSADVLSRVAHIKDLEALDIRLSDDKYLEGVPSLGGIDSLRVLIVTLADEVTGDSVLVDILKELRHLTQLSIHNQSVDGDLTSVLSGLASLNKVSLAISASLSPEIVRSLSGGKVRDLTLYMTGYKGDGRALFESISTLKVLEKLTLRSIAESVLPTSIGELVKSESIRAVAIVGYAKFDATVVEEIAKIDNLRELTLRGFVCREGMLNGIGKAKGLRRLVIGDIEGSVPAQELREVLESLDGLEHLVLLGASGVCPFEEWITGAASVESLVIDAERELSTAALREIAKMPSLKTLSLGVSTMTTEDLGVILSNASDSLKEVDVTSVPVEFDKAAFAALQRKYPGIKVKTAFN